MTIEGRRYSHIVDPRTGLPADSILSASIIASNPADAGALATAMRVNLELSRIDGPYRRPFLAVWIEDKDRLPVRTIALWYDRDRWLPDLRAWYRGDRLRALAEGTGIAASLASATRPPGKYSVKWDGKDQHGKPVKPGRYAVGIEAAREHGTYQLIRHEIEFAKAPWQVELRGNIEVASASLDYHRIAR